MAKLMSPDRTQHLRAILEAIYPGWTGITDPRFVAGEIDYKRDAIAKASARLSENALVDLIRRGHFIEVIERLEEVGKEPHFLYLSTPRSGDLSILYQSGLDREAFAHQIFDLLHGEETSPERLDRYAAWVDEQGLPNKWTFPTYFLFLTDPERNLFVKPQSAGHFLELMDAGFELGSRPTGDTYARFLALGDEIRAAFPADRDPAASTDLVAAQSIIWIAGRFGDSLGARSFDEARQKALLRLLDEFGRTHLTSEEGKQHLSLYPVVRATGRRNFETILEARDAGDDVTDLVLAGLLPHHDTSSNRARGAWVHHAPAITGDLKAWFESNRWARPEEWPRIAEAILTFVERAYRDPDRLEAACKEFGERDDIRGFQTGMLTPILNALAPERFTLINNKSRAVVNHFLGLKQSQQLVNYPALNSATHYLVNRIREPLLQLLPEGVSPYEGFDAFTHWLVSIKRYRFGRTQAWKIAVEDLERWQGWVNDGHIGLTERELADISGLNQKSWEIVRGGIEAELSESSSERFDEVRALAREVQDGDLILATHGTERVLGIGMVIGPYEYHENDEPQHRVPVEWHDTEPRAISEPGWQVRFHSIDMKEVERIRELRPLDETITDAAFTPRAFELLEGLHATQTRAYYDDRRAEFREHVEGAIQEVMNGIAALLPPSMEEVLETEKGVFSRIPKNDFGRGGAWPFYWGAFYPIGGKRIESAQLFISIDRNGLEYGFSIGDYGEDQRTRFLKNVRRQRGALLKTLAPQLNELAEPADNGGIHLRFGAEHDEDRNLIVDRIAPSAAEWLERIDEYALSVRTSVSRTELLTITEAKLQDQILTAFRALFPLVILAISDDPLRQISDYLGHDEDDDETREPYPLAACADDTGFDLATLRTWTDAIRRKGQAVLYGPPGTGKTYMAERLARHLAGGGDGVVELIQFHPAYAYEDFIQGIRPMTRADATLEYAMVPGRFLDFCRRAQNRSGTSVLIIDEINRANLARVFGELMYLLEYRNESIPLAGGERFHIPEKVVILGTMNTADRSIALVDHALRRRFAFIPLRPRYEILRGYHEGQAVAAEGLVEELIGLLGQINQAIGDPNYHLGITYFLTEKLEENLETIWRLEIEPYLEEYFFDSAETVDRFRWERVGGELVG